MPTAAPTAPVSRAVSNLRLYLSRLRHVSTSLSGGDIVAMGVPEGPRVGEVLRELLEARLDGVVESAEEERELASRRIDWREAEGHRTPAPALSPLGSGLRRNDDGRPRRR